jgi:uncharacterized protein YbjQ (UPF0145 family)|tara:strand:- start:648 stop:1043 length:396 start_codon:yes stop_codon:yes gene_type:complete
MLKKAIVLFSLMFLVSACSAWSDSQVTKDGKAVEIASVSETDKTDPSKIIITEGDITDKMYSVIGDIEVTVNKTTIFNADPTPEMVNEALKEKAAEMGADAVIFVRHGSVGVSFFSWGALEGKGRAVAFNK